MSMSAGQPRPHWHGTEELGRAGLCRVMGLEVKVAINGQVTELGMWVPERELLIPNPRLSYLAGARVTFPCTIHTSHGDLNYLAQGEVQ